METKAPPNAEPSAAGTPPEASRRRPGAPKRKGSSAPHSSTPSKRHAKDRPYHSSLLPPLHNGPVTRARQSPNKLAAATPELNKLPEVVQVEGPALQPEGDVGAKEEEEEGMTEKEAPFVDLEFEAIRSRGSDVHVVPTHAGWFQWKKVHPIEEQSMASFFDGKIENRTSDDYIEIRDAIIRKFHANPQTQIELKDLSELPIGEMDAKQHVLEFLDHWGLINFHPYPPGDSDACEPEADGEVKDLSLIEKLYTFDASQSHMSMGIIPKRMPSSASAAQPQLLTESKIVITKELGKPEEPSVEYHCNACSGDCTRKRYHCQKKADFDLCTDCYDAEKFGQGMVASDFILMDFAAVRGGGGGNWTDHETLLLLEAIELYGANWNEIAEHVATKTKAQCIYHFIRMPIEDPFLDDPDDPDIVPPENTNHPSANTDLDASNIPQEVHAKSLENGEPTSPTKDAGVARDQKVLDNANPSGSKVILDALAKSLQAVGSFHGHEGSLSFAESGNPVMALAAFLADIVDPDIITISTRSSLKAIYDDSPGIQLATRHCFPLEDPPSDSIDQPDNHMDVTDSESGVAQKEENQENQVQIDNESEATKENADTDNDKTIQTEKELLISSKECLEIPDVSGPGNTVSSGKCEAPSTEKELGDSSMQSGSPSAQVSDETANDALKMPKDSPSPEKGIATSMPSTPVETQNINDGGDMKSPKDSHVASVDEVKTSTDGDMMCNTASEDKELIESTSLSRADYQLGGDDKKISLDGEKDSKLSLDGENNIKKVISDVEKEGKCSETCHRRDMKIKHAAVTALAAAAVKAKILARQEEDQIRQVASLVIGKQLHKLELKLALLNEVDGMIMRVREQLDRARKKLYHERTQIIAARYGVSTSSKPPQGLPMRFAAAQGAAGSRQPNMTSQKPLVNKP